MKSLNHLLMYSLTDFHRDRLVAELHKRKWYSGAIKPQQECERGRLIGLEKLRISSPMSMCLAP